MTPPLDPAAAEQALATVRAQRAAAIHAVRPRWWLWLVAYLLLTVILVTPDLHLGSWLIPLMTAVLLAWLYLPRVWPALGAVWGAPLQLHQHAIPLPIRVGAFIVSMALAAVAVLVVEPAVHLGNWPVPTWAADHPRVVLSPVLAAVLVGVWLGMDRLARRWILRGTR